MQEEGSSPSFTKRMALEAYAYVQEHAVPKRLADIGCGRGELASLLSQHGHEIVMADSYRPRLLPPRATFVETNLNESWPIPDASIDFAFALEVIEHVENPRQFMREISRILVPGGYGFVSTPNNHSWMSKLTFLIRGEHRLFQAPSYPGHITALLKCDFMRIFQECGLQLVRCYYSNEDTLPILHYTVRLPGRAFSLSWGLLFRRPLV